MKYTMKITASLMAAAMSFSLLGATAGAVDFDVVGNENNKAETSSSTTSSNTLAATSTVQNAIPEFFNGCVKFTWSKVTSASSYAVKICSTDGTVIKTFYVSSKYNAVVVPETVFAVDYNSKKDFYACVIALKPNETDIATKTFYVPTASKFTVKSDMSEYPEYGTAQSVTFLVKNDKLLMGWKNPNDFEEKKDIFSISIYDRAGKLVSSKSTTTCNVEISGLKNGETYTVKIYNKTFSAMTSTEYKFVSDTKTAEQNSSEESAKKDTPSTLSAPSGIKAKSGDRSLTISWRSVDDADAYRIYMYDAKTKKYKSYKTVKKNNITIKSLKNGETYKFKIASLSYDKSTKSYITGKTSKAISGTPRKPASKKQ